MKRFIIAGALALGTLAALALPATAATAMGPGTGGHGTGRGVPALSAPNVYSTYKTGYVAHGDGRQFQRVTDSFTLPATSTLNGPAGGWRDYVQLSTGGHQFDADVLATAADTYAAEYRIDGTATAIALTPAIQPGDYMTETVSFAVHGDAALDFTVTDHTTGASVTVPDVAKPASGPVLYASVLAHPLLPAGCGGVNPIATDCLNSRIALLQAVQFEAYNGQTGALGGFVFPIANVVMTDNGFADGDLYASGNGPWPHVGGHIASLFMRP